MFFENNTQEAWQDAKKLGGLDELEAARPKVKNIVWQLYSAFSALRREADELKPIKAKEILDAVKTIYYEQDKAVEVIKNADDFYLKLCAEKIKRMNKK